MIRNVGDDATPRLATSNRLVAHVRNCLRRLAVEAKWLGASVHMPRVGCGLAGGRWEEVEPILFEELTSQGVGATVQDVD